MLVNESMKDFLVSVEPSVKSNKNNNRFWKDYITAECRYIIRKECFKIDDVDARFLVGSALESYMEQAVDKAVDNLAANGVKFDSKKADEFIDSFKEGFKSTFHNVLASINAC